MIFHNSSILSMSNFQIKEITNVDHLIGNCFFLLILFAGRGRLSLNIVYINWLDFGAYILTGQELILPFPCQNKKEAITGGYSCRPCFIFPCACLLSAPISPQSWNILWYQSALTVSGTDRCPRSRREAACDRVGLLPVWDGSDRIRDRSRRP